jgi:nucleoside-diphosphate-sugar epimerase
MKLAITGGTGFVGSHLLDVALDAGHQINALTRRDQPPRDNLRWIGGDMSDRAALEQLVDGVDAIVHVAGTISSPTAAGFELGNVAGTLAMLAAATAGGVRRFVHVSSLAAREPRLSLYGASKARAEELVHSSGLDWAIVRPPAVYGPGDKETLELFRMAKLVVMLMPPKGRVSVIHADDLAALLLALAQPTAPSNILVEADDGKPGGWNQVGRHLLARNPAAHRRTRRPAAAWSEGQADGRSRSLFLAPQLGGRAQACLPAKLVAARDRYAAGAQGYRSLVPRAGVALVRAEGR